MAQVSSIHNVGQSTQILHNAFNSHKPKSSNSVSLRSQLWGSSKSWSLKHSNGCAIGNCKVGVRKAGRFTVSASVAAEIVLQPIKDISGTIDLPGSKSLSH